GAEVHRRVSADGGLVRVQRADVEARRGAPRGGGGAGRTGDAGLVGDRGRYPEQSGGACAGRTGGGAGTVHGASRTAMLDGASRRCSAFTRISRRPVGRGASRGRL